MITNEKTMIVAGHRGDMYNCYENTMPSFETAVKNGVEMVETDVRVTKDGVLVLVHDEKVTRVADIPGVVAEMTYEEILKVNVGDDENPCKVPTYAEFMEWASKANVMLNIEIKEYYR